MLYLFSTDKHTLNIIKAGSTTIKSSYTIFNIATLNCRIKWEKLNSLASREWLESSSLGSAVTKYRFLGILELSLQGSFDFREGFY